MVETDVASDRARLVCRIVVVDDQLVQAQLATVAIKSAFELNVEHRRARAAPIEFVYCLSFLAPTEGESGEAFWDRCAGSFSGRIEKVNQTLWTRNALPSEKSVQARQFHVLVSDLLFESLKWSGAQRNGLDLIDVAKSRNPGLYCCMTTVADATQYENLSLRSTDRVLPKASLTDGHAMGQFVLAIDQSLNRHLESPFWDGLMEYAAMPKLVLHAMAAADGQSLTNDATTRDYLAFYGQRYFQAESSLTLEPLDSLLLPTGSIKRSQALYAAAFGARYARFSTNGTSAANSIVNLAVCSRGDYVIVDQNCHISHHYAYLRSGATPVFLKAERLEYCDEYSSVSPKELQRVMTTLIEMAETATLAKLPSLIILTNCTFDGIAVRPDYFISAVTETLDRYSILSRLGEIVFLFDEAWWGFARFDARLIEYTALYQAAKLRRTSGLLNQNLRLYVTHSTHKTLSSFRQTSAILIDDPFYDPDAYSGAYSRLQQSFLASTTTSPHAGMIASFDIARRQAVVDGARIIAESEYYADQFKQWLRRQTKAASTVGKFFRVVEDEELLGSLGDRAIVDPTKVSIEICADLPGPRAKKLLWKERGIQFNKYSRRRCLFMFTIGFKADGLELLKTELCKFAEAHQTLLSRKIRDLDHGDRDSEMTVLLESGGEAVFPRDLAKGLTWNTAKFVFREQVGYFKRRLMEIDAINESVQRGDSIYASNFVTPYPPGFPMIYPGQRLTREQAAYLSTMDDLEIHGIVSVDGRRKMGVFVEPARISRGAN